MPLMRVSCSALYPEIENLGEASNECEAFCLEELTRQSSRVDLLVGKSM